jgi:tRNA threonylcarbamoyladenosine biosynthesis protein TsaE
VELTIATPEAMRARAAALGRVCAPGDVIGLSGDLGAGKTTFVQGLAAGLGAGEATSPTFTLIHVHAGGRLTLYHADLYRLDRIEELEDVGLDDIYRQDGVAAVEWIDKIPGAAPADWLEIRLDVVDPGRRLRATAHGADARALLERWQSALSLER